ncbi:MAG: hypothetical protein ACK5JM_00645 [Rhodoblastus sp.]
MDDVVAVVARRGDLAHIALFLWASAASAMLWHTLRELAASNRRFEFFLRELARFNRRFGRGDLL